MHRSRSSREPPGSLVQERQELIDTRFVRSPVVSVLTADRWGLAGSERCARATDALAQPLTKHISNTVAYRLGVTVTLHPRVCRPPRWARRLLGTPT